MSIKKGFMVIAFGSLLGNSALADEGALSIYNNSPRAESATIEYWSADRIANAKPMPLGRVAGGASAFSYGSSILDFTRSRITPQSANTQKPYRSAGKLYFTIPGQGDYQCSASVIAYRLIVTAAHCMYSDGIGFHTNWVFIPGFDGTKSSPSDRPYGTWTWSAGTIPQAWVSTHGALPNNTDFGILSLNDLIPPGKTTVYKVGNLVGRLTTVVGHLFDTHVTMLGYPCNFDSCSIMQRVDTGDHRPGSTASDNNAFEYGSDMTGGSSGGPWVENFGGGAAPTGGFATRNAVVGVTSYGYTDPNVLILGASQFNSDFTTIQNTACGFQSGNC